MCNACGTELKIARIKAVAAGVDLPKGMTTIKDNFRPSANNFFFEVWAEGCRKWQSYTCCAYAAKAEYIVMRTNIDIRPWRTV